MVVIIVVDGSEPKGCRTSLSLGSEAVAEWFAVVTKDHNVKIMELLLKI